MILNGGLLHLRGAIAQLVERMDGIHEVTGSNPVGSTIFRFMRRLSTKALCKGWTVAIHFSKTLLPSHHLGIYSKNLLIKKGYKSMEKKKLQIIYFVLIILFLGTIAKSFMAEHGTLVGLQCTFIFWSFFVLCLPISRGKVLFGLPLQLFYERPPIMTELICWTLALVGNIASYIATPSVFYKTHFTLLLYNILTNPWPYWIIIVVCGIATFFTVYSQTSENTKIRRFGDLLIICSFITTFILAHTELIIVLNAHGNV